MVSDVIMDDFGPMARFQRLVTYGLKSCSSDAVDSERDKGTFMSYIAGTQTAPEETTAHYSSDHGFILNIGHYIIMLWTPYRRFLSG